MRRAFFWFFILGIATPQIAKSALPGDLTTHTIICDANNDSGLVKNKAFSLIRKENEELKYEYFYIVSKSWSQYKRGQFVKKIEPINSYTVEDGLIWFRVIYNAMDFKGSKGKKGFLILD